MGRTAAEIIKTRSAAQRKAIKKRGEALIIEELTLRELRKTLGLTQALVAKRLKKGQDRVSRIEQSGDLLLSTLLDYVRSLGGELELVCRFKDKPDVKLKVV